MPRFIHLLIVFQCLAAGKDPAGILEKITATYEQILDYSVEVETRVADDLGAAPTTKSRYVLAGSKPRHWYSHVRVLAPIRYEVRVGSDGEVTWAYSPTSGKYVTGKSGLETSDQRTALREHHFRLFRKFETLDRLAVEVKLIGERSVSDGKAKIRCAVLRLTPTDRKDWIEDIWVDTNRHLVLKSRFRAKKLYQNVTTTTVWRNFRINDPPDPSIFVFVPPSDATRTNAIPIP
jgi:outer membrane lipoprotein-sorting protein